MAWIEDVYFSSKGFILDVPKWDFADRGISVILGDSGSGKTTLLQILAGLLPSKVKMTVGGQLISELPPRERNIGFVFQDYALFPHLTAKENILFAAQAKRLPESIITPHLEKLMARLDLHRIKDTKAQFLSGGEQQRVALARALVTKPHLVLLDEPFGALDEARRDEARDLVSELAQEFNVPFILVTHDLRDVRRLSSGILVLHEGSVLGIGPTNAILEHPPTLTLARAISENQILNLKIRNNISYLSDFPIPFKGSSLVAKNWSFQISTSKSPSTLRGMLINVWDEGSHLLCRIKLSDGQSLRAIAPLELKSALSPGSQVELTLDEKTVTCYS